MQNINCIGTNQIEIGTKNKNFLEEVWSGEAAYEVVLYEVV